jgi:hypothetical protein
MNEAIMEQKTNTRGVEMLDVMGLSPYIVYIRVMVKVDISLSMYIHQ